MKKTVLKKITALFLAGMLIFSMTACGTNDAGKGKEETSSSENAAEIEENEPESTEIRLTDQAGREIVLEKPAETIVSCYYITTYAVIALDVDDRVVGLEKKAETRPIYQMAAPELLEKEQVGSMKEFNVEATAALEPDLVLMPKKLMEYAETLTELGIPVLVVNPESQEELEEMLLLIGEACGAEDRAEALISYYNEQLELIESRIKDTEAMRVYMAGNSSYLETAPASMYQSSLIELAGGTNAAAEIEGDYWTEVSYETILSMNPDVILIPCGSVYTTEDVKADPQLADVAAIQNDKVYQMPQQIEEWDSPVPSGFLGVMWVTSVLHPDKYSFEEFTEDAVDFYETFYGFEIDKSLITQ